MNPSPKPLASGMLVVNISFALAQYLWRSFSVNSPSLSLRYPHDAEKVFVTVRHSKMFPWNNSPRDEHNEHLVGLCIVKAPSRDYSEAILGLRLDDGGSKYVV